MMAHDRACQFLKFLNALSSSTLAMPYVLFSKMGGNATHLEERLEPSSNSSSKKLLISLLVMVLPPTANFANPLLNPCYFVCPSVTPGTFLHTTEELVIFF
jgi:hypothetical protein